MRSGCLFVSQKDFQCCSSEMWSSTALIFLPNNTNDQNEHCDIIPSLDTPLVTSKPQHLMRLRDPDSSTNVMRVKFCVLPRRHGGPLHNVFRGDLVNLHIQISTRTWLVLTRDTSIDCRGLVSRDNVIKSHFRRRVFTNLRRCLLARKIQCACVPPKCTQPSRPRADSVSGNRLRAQLKFNA